ncbi:hypothetical protein H6504_01475 [Candidatus Woesearchaeota archaeon]|nr:hypothetical protein [Candidatus Woesearchaeota archaeon]
MKANEFARKYVSEQLARHDIVPTGQLESSTHQLTHLLEDLTGNPLDSIEELFAHQTPMPDSMGPLVYIGVVEYVKDDSCNLYKGTLTPTGVSCVNDYFGMIKHAPLPR